MEEQELSKKERKELRRQERRTEVQKMKQQWGLKRLVLWLGVIAFFGLGIWAVIALVPEPPETVEGSNLPVVTEKDHFKGSVDAPVVLVEYGDFQCLACRAFFSILQQLEGEFGEQIKFVFRHYPLRAIHPQAEMASRATEAAALQGKFWEMHNVIFETQSAWSGDRNAKNVFVEYAQNLGLDVAQFEQDIELASVKDKVQTDLSGGNLAGVQGTPSFFLQGKRIANPRNHGEFQALIQQTLQSP